MSDIVLNIIMARLGDRVYCDIIQGISAGLAEDATRAEGILEYDYGVYELVFWFCVSFDEAKEGCLDRWMALTFMGGMRCSNDFDITRLERLLREL